MELKELLRDDDAVSPVIGVILMVAITVILAAVIASFVLGIGTQTNSNPQASFSFDYDASGDTDSDEGLLRITHDGGDSIKAQELYVRGKNYAGTTNIPTEDHIRDDGAWTKSGDYSDGDSISAGKYLRVNVESDYDLSVVYEPVEGGTSTTLAQDKGPAAS